MAVPRLSREKLWMSIGASYAAITAFAASTIYVRHMDIQRYPEEASSGMYAAGDALLAIFLSVLYLVPTVFVLRLLAENIRLYEVYAHVLLALSITAPIAMCVLIANSLLKTHGLEGLAILRLLGSPMVLIVMAASRWAARSAAAIRSMDYAMLAEALSLLGIVSMFVLA